MAESVSARLEQQLANAGLQVAVEESEGALVLSGVVDSEEARQAAQDIAEQTAPQARIDNQLDVETVLPTDLDDFAGGEPTAEMADSVSDLAASGAEQEPDFTDQPIMHDPNEASGPDSWGPEDAVSTGDEVYVPPDDPVVTTNARGEAQVLGGYGTEDEITVEASALDGQPGDEALADAVRRELAEDAATADLEIVVAVRRGVVHLRGRVGDMDDADNAEAVAARVPGVRDVVEELEVAGL